MDHIPGAVSAPYIEILKQPNFLQQVDHDTMIVCYGFDSEDKQMKQAADILEQRGFSEILILHNGFSEWIEMGYPVEKSDEL